MKSLVIALLIVGLSAAFTVEPDYFGVKDTGDESLPTMDVGITIDCESKGLIVDVSSQGQPVEGATVYLFYTDYGYQALPNTGDTDASGVYEMEVTGSLEFLTALFILRVDEPGYQSREIEFAYEKCFQEPPEEPEPECMSDADCAPGYVCDDEECVEAPEPECIADSDCSAGYICQGNECIEAPEPEEPEPPEPNITENETVIAPPPEEPPPEEEAPQACPIGFILLSLLVLRLKV